MTPIGDLQGGESCEFAEIIFPRDKIVEETSTCNTKCDAIVFYRLPQRKITENNDNKENLDINISIKPVDKTNVFTVSIDSKSNFNLTVEIYDLTGNIIETTNKNIKEGNQLFQVDLSSYYSGTYFISFFNNGNYLYSTKILVKK
jgi:hypothetical protein